MVICGSYIFEFSVGKNMKKRITVIKGESNISSNTICQELKINVEQVRMVTTLNIINTKYHI